MPIIYSIAGLVLLNICCNITLSVLMKREMLLEYTVFPPLAIITLLYYPFRSKKHVKEEQLETVTEQLHLTESEQNYLLDHATPEELAVLCEVNHSYTHRKQVIEIKNKYKNLYKYDSWSRLNNNVSNEEYLNE